MFLKVFDFVMTFVTIYFAVTWGDKVTSHAWIVAILIGACSAVSFLRGKFTS